MDSRRRVPRTDALLADPRIALAEKRLGRSLAKAAITQAQAQARSGAIFPEEVADAAVALLPARACSLTPVINATGVVLHTNLGRAPLSEAARDAIWAVTGCTDLEFDLATGKRDRRGRSVMDALASAVPAAEAVHVVNNNAAALVLAATALAVGREIVISRGELVEIGDRFRVPDLLTSTGARLREVGTTNRTTADDYRAAIGPETAFVLKVHPSNFRVEGFTEQAGVEELTNLGVPVIDDIGSGLLQPHKLFPAEPDADSALRAGAALVTASGDKLLGGPQAGLLMGREAVVRQLVRHPLARALRVDKLTLAALEATLTGPASPTAQALATDTDALYRRADGISSSLRAAGIDARPVMSEGTVGGGGAPGVVLPSAGVSLPARLSTPLRCGERVRRGQCPAVVGRTDGGRLLLDLRAVLPEDDDVLCDAVIGAHRLDTHE